MLTFYDLQQHVLRYIDESESASTGSTRVLVKDAINRSHRRLLGSRTWSFMRWPGEVSLTTTAGTRTYALKHGMSKILTLYDQGTEQTFPLISRREWEAQGVDRVNRQDQPLGAIYGDTWPVSEQCPEDDTQCAVLALSSSTVDAADSTITVVVTGIANGDYTTETLNVQHTGDAFPVYSTARFSHILSVTKTGTWAGTMTLKHADVDASTILTLSTTEYGKQYPTLEFIETPSAARTYLYTAQRTPAILSNDYDIPDTPYPFSEIHAYDALMDLCSYNTELGARHYAQW